MRNKFKNEIKKLRKNGFFSIYFSTICLKVVTLFGGILIVRLLNKEDYGTYTLVLNAISILSIFGDLGASDATLQYALEKEDNEKKQKGTFIFGIKMLLFSTLFSSLLILLSPLFYPYKDINIEKLTFMLIFIPTLTSFVNYIAILLRVKKENKKFSCYQLLSTFIHYLIVIICTIFWGLNGSLLSQYLYNIVIIIIGILIIKKNVSVGDYDKLEKKEKKDFLKLAIATQFNHTLSNMLYSVDIFILGIMIIKTSDVSIYKVATVIPTALVFLPQCLMIYFLPYFVKNSGDKKWIKTGTKKLILYSIPFYAIITLIFIFLSKYIILLLYGKEYIDATMPFILLMIGFFFTATIKEPITSIAYVLHKIKFNVYMSIFSLIFNLILNILFVKLFGVVGVAISTLIINILCALISIIYIKKVLKEDRDCFIKN